MIKFIQETFGFSILITLIAFTISGAYFSVTGQERILGEKEVVREFVIEPMHEESSSKKKIEDAERVSLFIKRGESFEYVELSLDSVRIQWGEPKYIETAQMYKLKGKMRKGDNSNYYTPNSVEITIVVPKEEINKYLVFK
jgi:hypothetical protein